MKTISIAIDGPSGAGKSTLACSVSARLGYVYVDTGALYRTIGYYIYSKEIDPKNEAAVAAQLPDIRVEMCHGEDGLQHMILNGQDVTREIRLPRSPCMPLLSLPILPCVRFCWRCSVSWPAPIMSSWTDAISAP